MNRVILLILWGIVGLLFLFIIVGAGYQYVATKLDERKYSPIGTLVDIGGYKLHMIDLGKGKLTVVIDAGAGSNSLVWALVYPEIAKFARVVVYDRAGYGWSDPSPLSRTSENIVKELHAMLHNADVPAPYILVGHSFGGMNVRLFAATYPEEVAGVILVDSAHEDQIKSPGNFIPKVADTLFLEWKKYLETYLGINRFLRSRSGRYVELKKSIGMLPAEIQDAYLALLLPSKFMEAKANEIHNFILSCNQLKFNGGFTSDKPLVVITAGNTKINEEHAQEKENYRRKLQADLVKKSSQGKQIIAEESGHMIPIDQPEIIIGAVRAMCEKLAK